MDAVSTLQEKLELIARDGGGDHENKQPLRLTQPSYVKHSTHPVQMAFFDLSLMIYIIY